MKALLNLSVTGPLGRKRSRISAVARALDGGVIALGARHLLTAEVSDQIWQAGPRKLVGRRLHWSQADGDRRPGHEAIGGVRVEANFDRPGMTSSHLPISGIVKAEAALGQTVFKLGSAQKGVEGTVTGLGSVKLRDPITERVTVFSGLVEVCLATDDATTVGSGEAGALFVDVECRALGLLIGGGPKRCFLVSLADVLEARNLVPYLAGLPQLRTTQLHPSPTSSMEMELDAVKAGSKQFWKDLHDEPSMLADPAGNRVPPELSALLETTV